MKKFLFPVLSILFLIGGLLCGPHAIWAASGIYGATCRTGGGACVDGIDVTDPKGDGSNIGLAAGDMCFVVVDAGTVQPELYIYRLYASGTAESDPIIIQPNTIGGAAYSGTLRWHLVTPVGAGLGSAAVDGQNRIYITNNTSRTPTASANEFYPVNNAWVMAENGSAVGNVVSTTKVQTLTNKTISAPQVVITTSGLTQDNVYYLTSGGAWTAADADGTGTYPARCYAISTTQCMTSGVYTKSSHGFTVGANIYLSTTPGGVTSTAPTANNLQVIGWILDANTIVINVSPDYGTF